MGFLYKKKRKEKTLALRVYLQIKKTDQLQPTRFSDVHFQFKIYLQENSCYTDHRWSSQRNKFKGCMKKPLKYCLEINEKLMYASLNWEISKFHSGLISRTTEKKW